MDTSDSISLGLQSQEFVVGRKEVVFMLYGILYYAKLVEKILRFLAKMWKDNQIEKNLGPTMMRCTIENQV